MYTSRLQYSLVGQSDIHTYLRIRYRDLVWLRVNGFQEERFFAIESEDLGVIDGIALLDDKHFTASA